MKQNQQRTVLTEAIAAKVHRLDMKALVKLAAELKVALPEERTKSQRQRPAALIHTGGLTGSVLVGKGIGRVLPTREGARRIDRITTDNEATDWAESDLVGAGEVVSRLNIARATLDNWRKGNKVVALRKGLRNYVYPLRQFGRLGPVAGLEKVVPVFAAPEEAWEWLVTPNRMTGGKMPIDELQAGNVHTVVRAAEGALDYT